jgi:PhnB protein
MSTNGKEFIHAASEQREDADLEFCYDVGIGGPMTTLSATLSVRNWSAAMDFYTRAFGAKELFSIPGGGVGQLAIDGATFWVAEESKEHLNFSPESLGGCSVRMLLIVDDPDAVVARAIAAGAKEMIPVRDEYGWRLGRVIDPAGHHWEIGRPL